MTTLRTIATTPIRPKTEDAKIVKPTPQELRKIARARFNRSRLAEKSFARQLVKLGRHIGRLVERHAPGGVLKSWAALRTALNDYAEQLKPWAEAIAEKMQAEVGQRDAQAWYQASKEIGQHLRKEIEKAPTGRALRSLLSEQVDLITSLPTDAAKRVHKLTIGAVVSGRRAEDIAQEILKTGQVTESRARLIARTEVARTASILTETRAKHIGSEGYIWRTSMDSDVRPAIGAPNFSRLNTIAMGSHRKLEGTFHRWDDPPVAAPDGTKAHAGQLWNCRCWPEPVLPDRI